MPDFIFDQTENLNNLGGPAAKFPSNISALRLLKQLEAEEREASPAEQKVLARYVGWGDSNLLKLAFPRGTSIHANPAAELRELLTDDEVRQVRGSSLTAFYTPPAIIRGIYEGLDGLLGSFTQDQTLRVLEPSAGVGHFIGAMPTSLRARATCAAVEIDSISARITQQLYPSVKVLATGFEDARLPQNYFDLIISNIPFSDIRVVDPEIKLKYLKARVHDYFFVKALRVARPGGLVVFITSRGTLDKQDDRVRRYVAEHAELMAAVRLPSTAFRQNAGTEVIADLLILQKRQNPDPSAPDYEGWVKLSTIAVPRKAGGTANVEINTIFAQDPQLLLGQPLVESGMYNGSEQFTVKGDNRDLQQSIADTLHRVLPSNTTSCFTGHRLETTSATTQGSLLPPDAAPTTTGEVDPEEKQKLFTPDSQRSAQASALLDLYSAAKMVINLQLVDATDEQLKEAQDELNDLYDRFRLRFGYINSKHNIKAFRRDNPLLSFLRALEEPATSNGCFNKAAIFRQRTVRPHKHPTHADTPKEALLLCLNEKGRVEMETIARLCRTSVADAAHQLKGLVFQTPDGVWLTADEYLSGNVRARLMEAEAAAALDPEFAGHVAALKAAQPRPLGPGEIIARLGAGWIPAEIIEDFANELVPEYTGKIEYLEPLATWRVERLELAAALSHGAIQRWGTRRADAFALLEDALNLRRTVVYDYTGTGKNRKRELNQVETVAALAKLADIKERFQEWVWEDPAREQRLRQIYNERFNTMRERRYDGSHLSLPGASLKVSLNPHQKDAVWRILQRTATLLGHPVGSGKTICAIAAAAELRRLGIARKPMAVVPKIAVTQWAAEATRLYPGIRLLTTDVADFTRERRGETMSRIATGDWDLIIVPHSSFKLLPVKDATCNRFIQKEIDRLQDYLRDLEEDEEQSSRATIKQLERAARKLESKLRGDASEIRRDDERIITWEELGIDTLFVDEADEFKNLYAPSKMERISGLPCSESQKAFDLFMKTRLLFAEAGRVVFLTGTPVSNTLAEVHAMMRYLQLDLLEELGLDQFDAWAQCFAATTTGLEMKPDGSGYRQHTRFNQFVNLPELSNLWRQCLDVRTAEEVNLPTPQIAGTEATVVGAPARPELLDFVKELNHRSEVIRQGGISPKKDNMLKVTTDGRKGALDMSLVNPDITEHPDDKINYLVERVARFYERSRANRGTQLIFADLGTPKGRSPVKGGVQELELEP